MGSRITVRLDDRQAHALALLGRLNGRSSSGEARFALERHLSRALNDGAAGAQSAARPNRAISEPDNAARY